MSSFRKENLTEKDHLLNSSISDKEKETRLTWLTKLWRTNCCPWIKCRVVITIMCFLGFCNVYALRVNLSLAIVVMVNDTEAVSQPHKIFDWNHTEQGWLLAAFFCGYILTQVPGGWLAQRYGGKYIFGVGIVMTAVLTLVTPLAAYISVWCLVGVRILEGIFEGVTFPAAHALISKWAPPAERSRVVTFAFSGQYVGTVISFPISALLCVYGFSGGWPSVFYIFGIIGIIWFIFWLLLGFDSPATHPRISQSEREYIETSISEAKVEEIHVPTPWLQIFLSPPVWAITIANFCSNFGMYVLLTTMPTYFSQALGFDLGKGLLMNGVFSAIPFTFLSLVTILAGPLADFLRSRYLSTTVTRKLFASTSLTLSALFLLLCGYFGTSKLIALSLLTAGVGCVGLAVAGYSVNQIDLAPRFAGVLMGITNGVGNSAGIIAPVVAKAIAHSKHATREVYVEEWRQVFMIAAEVYLFGAIIYAILADGKKQWWAEGVKWKNGKWIHPYTLPHLAENGFTIQS